MVHPVVNAVLPSQPLPSGGGRSYFRPTCAQYNNTLPGGLVSTGPYSQQGTCTPNVPGNPFVVPDFVCNSGICTAPSGLGPQYPGPNAYCCNAANNNSNWSPGWSPGWSNWSPWPRPGPWPGPGPRPRDFPMECCRGNDNQQCALCVTQVEGQRYPNEAGNHLSNMTRCRNNCFQSRSGGLSSPERRLLAENTFG